MCLVMKLTILNIFEFNIVLNFNQSFLNLCIVKIMNYYNFDKI